MRLWHSLTVGSAVSARVWVDPVRCHGARHPAQPCPGFGCRLMGSAAMRSGILETETGLTVSRHPPPPPASCHWHSPPHGAGLDAVSTERPRYRTATRRRNLSRGWFGPQHMKLSWPFQPTRRDRDQYRSTSLSIVLMVPAGGWQRPSKAGTNRGDHRPRNRNLSRRSKRLRQASRRPSAVVQPRCRRTRSLPAWRPGKVTRPAPTRLGETHGSLCCVGVVRLCSATARVNSPERRPVAGAERKHGAIALAVRHVGAVKAVTLGVATVSAVHGRTSGRAPVQSACSGQRGGWKDQHYQALCPQRLLRLVPVHHRGRFCA